MTASDQHRHHSLTVLEILERLARNEHDAEHRLSLVPSENQSSALGRSALLLDVYNRYFFNIDNKPGLWQFSGAEDVWDLEGRIAAEFGVMLAAKHVTLRPLSGINAMLLVFAALGGPVGTRVCTVARRQGGHPAARRIAERLGLEVSHLSGATPHEIDLHEAERMLEETRPHLVYVDQSHCLFPTDIRALSLAIRRVSPETLLHVDISHWLGLIIGGALPNPLLCGADSISASTHKTFPGPQKALVATNDENIFARVADAQSYVVSSHHFGTVIGLGLALHELLANNVGDYAGKVVANTRVFGDLLAQRGFVPECRERGYSAGHQLWVSTEPAGINAYVFSRRLRECGVLVNALDDLPDMPDPSLRLGLHEATYRGFGYDELVVLAGVIVEATVPGSDTARLRRVVGDLCDKSSYPYWLVDDNRTRTGFLDDLITQLRQRTAKLVAFGDQRKKGEQGYMDAHHREIVDACRASMAQILELKDVPGDVSFFALGGTSSTAVTWMLDIAERTGIEVDMADIFEAPSPVELASLLCERADTRSEPVSGAGGEWPASEKQAMRLEAARYSREQGVELPNAGPELLVVGLRLVGRLNVTHLSHAVDAAIDRHGLLRAAFTRDGQWYRVRIKDRSFGLEVTDDLSELYQPFDFDSGRLARFLLTRRSDDEHELWIAVEHVAADRDSIYLLLSDLATFYNRLHEGREFGEVAHRGVQGPMLGEYEVRQTASPAGQQSRELYDQQIGDGVPYRQLTGEFVGVPNKAERGRRVIGQAALSQDELDKLHARCAEEAASLTTAVIATVSSALDQVLGVSDLTAYCVVGNRSSELAQTVGPIASVVPVRVRRDELPTRAPWRWVSGVVNRSLAKTALHFDRYARERGSWGAYEDSAIVVVNVFVKAAVDPFDMTDLEITEIPAKALVSDKLVLTFQVDYDAHGLNLTIDGPTGLMTASQMDDLVDVVVAGLRGEHR